MVSAETVTSVYFTFNHTYSDVQTKTWLCGNLAGCAAFRNIFDVRTLHFVKFSSLQRVLCKTHCRLDQILKL